MSEPAQGGGHLAAGDLRRVTATLAVTEIVNWGALYYALPVLAPSIEAETGWTVTAVLSALTGALLVSAVAGVWVGRLIDGHGPRRLMTAASVLGSASLLVAAEARSYPVFLAAWLVAGAAMSGLLYAPAFAALNGWASPTSRLKAITAVTLVAGLASTVFAPLTAFFIEATDWRTTLRLLAVAVLLTAPAHHLLLRPRWISRVSREASTAAVALTRPFIVLAVVFSAMAFVAYSVVTNLVPLLIGQQLSLSTAAYLVGLGGIGQVAGRLVMPWLQRAASVTVLTFTVFATIAVTTAALAIVSTEFVIGAIVLVAGMARGVFTITTATATIDRWGDKNVGHLSGILNAPYMAASALAPAGTAGLAAAVGGYPHAFLLLAAIAAVATAFTAATFPARHPAG